ncbi:MAG: bifunctional 5,10-methylenetetrahydrofolate dehydrogenase/5,10-methenyltetrahydrofolate cyclohydrolase [Chloroflexota bacterium]|nr:bifunctional 5,10-methylenetetrahydrofolate dehydrogenase/5,10-methenyltetrahydrofolate cyclohydrolase [Chloroflexota bacterium]
MSAKILDGRKVSKEIRAEVKKGTSSFEAEWNATPTLALVRAGSDPASVSYAGMIKRTCEKCGIAFEAHTRPADVSEDEMVSLVRRLNDDESVHGIIIQQPMPEGVRSPVVIEALNPAKDVDGAHPLNAGRLAKAAFVDRPQDVGPYIVPATPLGGLELLKRYNLEMDGQRVVIVGASNLIGKPLSLLLTRHWATVTVCDLHTKPLAEITRQADILASVTGVAHLISADMVKPGATVLDFGFAKLDGEWVGDVDFEAVKEIASAITPVPGGAGPMTNAMLMRNTLMAAERQVRFGIKQASRVAPIGVSPMPLGTETARPHSGLVAR